MRRKPSNVLKIRDYSQIKLDSAQLDAQAYKNFLGGKAENWEKRGAFQLELLRFMGLHPGASFLDVGCGPIRAGVHFIRFLDPGNYHGVDFSPSFIEAAHRIVESEGLTPRAARISMLAGFDFARMGRSYDCILCFSVLNHCSPTDRNRFFQRIPIVMHENTRLVITHGGWFDTRSLEGTALSLQATLADETDLPEHLKFADWGFGEAGDRLPILQLRLDR